MAYRGASNFQLCDLLIQMSCEEAGSAIHRGGQTRERRTKPSCYLARLALDKEINPLVLVTQFTIQLILESMKSSRFVIAAGYSFCLTLPLGCAELY